MEAPTHGASQGDALAAFRGFTGQAETHSVDALPVLHRNIASQLGALKPEPLVRLADRPPFAALTHRGRKTGDEYRVPLNAFPAADGYVIALTYGSTTDWVKNVLAAGHAQLHYGGQLQTLTRPEIVGRAEAWPYLPRSTRIFLRILRVNEFLVARVDAELDVNAGAGADARARRPAP